MKIDYTQTKEDYKAAYRLHVQQRIGKRVYFALFKLVAPALMLLLVIGIIASIPGRGPSVISYAIVPSILLLVVLYKFRSRYQLLAPVSVSNVTLEVGADGISSRSPGVSEGKTFWSGMTSAAQDRDVMLMYTSDRSIIMIPTRVLYPAQRAELADLVARHIPKRRS